MVEILEQTTPTCLAVRFGGKVTGDDYRQFVDAAADRLQTGREAALVLELTEFEFYGDFEAGWEDFKFGLGEYNHFSRTALVGDRKWIGWFVRLIGPFTRAEERQFAAGQLEEALAWANASQQP